MPRTYVKKRVRKYNEITLQKAIALVKNKELSQNQACKQFGIPRSTLTDKLSGKSASTVTTAGRKPFLEPHEEIKLKNWLIAMMEKGFSFTNVEISNVVKNVIDRSGEKSSFMNNRPSLDWCSELRKRHPELNETPLTLTFDMTERLLLTTLQNLNINHAYQVYNCSEINFSDFPATPLTADEISSVMLCICADGDSLKPYFTREGSDINSITADRILKLPVQVTSTGLFTHEAFEHWLKHVFIPFISHKCSNKPVVLLLDNTDIHKQYHLKGLFKKHNITLFCYPPSQSTLISPIQSGLINPLKMLYLIERRRLLDERDHFAITRAFKNAYPKSFCEEIIKDSFSENGICFGFNPCIDSVVSEASCSSNTDFVHTDDEIEIVDICGIDYEMNDTCNDALVAYEACVEEDIRGNASSSTSYEFEEQRQKSCTRFALKFIETFVLTEEQKRMFQLKLETDTSEMFSNDHMYDVWKVLSKNN